MNDLYFDMDVLIRVCSTPFCDIFSRKSNEQRVNNMKVELSKSKNKLKKFRVTLQDGTHVDFGGKGYSDYTIHKDPERMRLYVRRHGGIIDDEILQLTSGKQIHKRMLTVDKSDSENWSGDGMSTAGFWSRWLLWSHPSFSESVAFIEKKFGVKIKVKVKA